MSIEQMREAISDAYSSDGWKRKVSRMPEDQVMAVYFKLKERGCLDKKHHKPKREYTKPTVSISRDERPVQLTFDDLLAGRC